MTVPSLAQWHLTCEQGSTFGGRFWRRRILLLLLSTLRLLGFFLKGLGFCRSGTILNLGSNPFPRMLTTSNRMTKPSMNWVSVARNYESMLLTRGSNPSSRKNYWLSTNWIQSHMPLSLEPTLKPSLLSFAPMIASIGFSRERPGRIVIYCQCDTLAGFKFCRGFGWQAWPRDWRYCIHSLQNPTKVTKPLIRV